MQCPTSITEGSDVTIHCNATGNPPPNVTWIWQDTGDVLGSSEQLTLIAVNRTQAGTYQCHAWNGIGISSVRDCLLDVLSTLYMPLREYILKPTSMQCTFFLYFLNSLVLRQAYH